MSYFAIGWQRCDGPHGHVRGVPVHGVGASIGGLLFAFVFRLTFAFVRMTDQRSIPIRWGRAGNML